MNSKTPETETFETVAHEAAVDLFTAGRLRGTGAVAPQDWEREIGMTVDRLLVAHTAALEAAKREARIDKLQGVQEHHDAIPVPWEVGTGPYIAGRLTQLSTHLPWEQTDDNKYDGLPRAQIMQMKTDLSHPNQPKQGDK